jgi:hypothetical protein
MGEAWGASTGATGEAVTVYTWRVRTRLPERFGTQCVVLVRSRRMNSCLVRFLADGYRVVTSRNYLRKAP